MRAKALGLSLIAVSIGCAIVAACLISYYAPIKEPEEVRIDPGDHISREFTINRDVTEILYHVDVESGPPVDFYVLTESDYQRYLHGLRPLDDESLVYENVEYVHGSPYLFIGEYRFVIDNSDYGMTSPLSQEAVVECRFSHPGPDLTSSTFLIWGLGGVFLLLLPIGILLVVHSDRQPHPIPPNP